MKTASASTDVRTWDVVPRQLRWRYRVPAGYELPDPETWDEPDIDWGELDCPQGRPGYGRFAGDGDVGHVVIAHVTACYDQEQDSTIVEWVGREDGDTAEIHMLGYPTADEIIEVSMDEAPTATTWWLSGPRAGDVVGVELVPRTYQDWTDTCHPRTVTAGCYVYVVREVGIELVETGMAMCAEAVD